MKLAVPLTLVALSLTTALAETPQCDSACWSDALARYLQDPPRQRRAFVAHDARDASSLGEIPPAALLALADAHLRLGRLRTADALFRTAIDRDLGSPYAGWAHLGRAWIALRAGRYAAARDELARVADGDDGSAPVGVFMLGMLDIATGFPADAGQRFTELQAAPGTPATLRHASRVAAAYALYRAGEYAAARDAFDALGALGGPASDVARYGAARSALAEGDRQIALERLRRIVGTAGSSRGDGVVATAILDLEPRAVLERGFAAYRRAPIAAPQAQIAALLAWDGPALARALLRKLEGSSSPDARASSPAHASGAAPATSTTHTSITERRDAAPEREDAATRRGQRDRAVLQLGPWLLATVLSSAAILVWRRRARPPSSPRRDS